jgi:RecA/RadA recombinase
MAIIDSGECTKRLRDVAVDVNRDIKNEVAVAGQDRNLSDVGKVRVPTTSYMLNLLLGGGIPLGRVMEIYGDESVGKSTIGEHICVGFQRANGISILLDADTGWHRQRAYAMGHNSDRHMHLQADTVELGAETTIKTIEKLRMRGRFPENMPVVILWDAISASQTEGEKTGDLYKDGMADKPRKIRQLLRSVAPMLPRYNVSLIFISHTIMEIKKGSNRPPRKISGAGGDAIKFWSGKRLHVRRVSRMDYPQENSGLIACVKNVKDKLDPPNREVYLPIMNKTGVDPNYELLNYLIDNSNWVNMDAGRVSIPNYPNDGQDLTFYMKQFPSILDKHSELTDYLTACVDDTWSV